VLPERLPLRGIECEQIALAVAFVGLLDAGIAAVRRRALKHQNVELSAVKQRAAAIDPVDVEFPVVLREIALPDLLAGKIECRELPRADERPDRPAIRHRRR
jgi:hypothetical protein